MGTVSKAGQARRFFVVFSDDERAELRAFAERMGLPAATLARRLMLRALREAAARASRPELAPVRGCDG